MKESSALLTEGYISGVNPITGLQPNANLEGGEYTKFPDGSVAQVLGERHTNGGVNLVLPEYTKILSDTKDLTLTKQDAKKLQKDLGVTLTDKNTYSDVLDKYAKKIGYTKSLKEQADIFTQVQKLSEASTDDTTFRLNTAFMSKKLEELEQTRLALEIDMGRAFDLVFPQQERQKGTPEEEINEEIPQQTEVISTDFTEEEMFKYGGEIEKIQQITQGKSISPRVIFDRLLQEGKLPKFDNGGIFRVGRNENTYSNANEFIRTDQSANTTAYGKSSATEAINQLYRNFPNIFNSGKYNDLFDIENGVVKIKSGVKFNTNNPRFESLQRDIDTQMRATANHIINNRDRYNNDSYTYAQEYLKNETFDSSKARAYDGLLGNFSSGRFSLGVDIVTPEEAKKLSDKGIYSVRQLNEAKPEDIAFLSNGSKDRLNKFSEGLSDDADFTLNTYTPPRTPSTPSTPVTTPKEEQKDAGSNPQDLNDETLTLGDDGRVQQRYPRRFLTPGYGVLPPTGLQAETLEQIELSRIDPLRQGIEQQLSKTGEMRTQAFRQFDDLPPAQRAAAIASTLATTQSIEADAITQVNQINAQNQAQADLYNNAQADKETMANANQRLDYERRVLRGLDNTERDVRQYYTVMNNAFKNDWNEQIKLNTLDQMFPRVSIDNWGIGANYDPDRPYQLAPINENYWKTITAMQMKPNLPEKTTKKKTSE